MIMPTKIIKPIDSLIVISSFLLKLLMENEYNSDELYYELNKIYLKKVEFEKYLLTLNFLNTVDKVVIENDIIRIKM